MKIYKIVIKSIENFRYNNQNLPYTTINKGEDAFFRERLFYIKVIQNLFLKYYWRIHNIT